jgi:phospholipid N-methyltransferase
VFDLVELNENFVSLLNQRFASEESWQKVADIAQVHQMPLQEFNTEEPYDFVISGLPLNNFPADLVAAITKDYLRLLKPGGVLSYFEYMYVRPVRKVISRGDENTRIRKIDDIMGQLCSSYRIRRDNIWLNIPPAWVQHLQQS